MSAYDLHCHILPAIDDGPERAEEAFAMAQVAATDGTSVVVATPHARQVAAHGGRRALDQWVADFNRTSRGLGIEVLVGAEHLLTMDLIDDVRRGIAITLNNSRYLLVEINFLQYPPYISEALFQIQVRGMVPVLAHPERQATIQKQPDILADLVECGVVSQVTGGSLLGHFGPEAQRSAEYLVQHNLVHAIASDGHSPGSYRPPVLFEAARAVEDLVGMAGARLLTEQNPQAIVSDGTVRLPEAQPARRILSWPGQR
ncbi:MAG: hypothetical protein O7D33_01260 [Chloroflexi bacterium]|nr:hypothetical protein [Chloroflexota bacterium]